MSGSLEKISILIIDDSAHIRRLLVTMLKSFGCQRVFEARTAVQALDVLTHKEIDIILVDWMLEGSHINGIELVREIRASPLDNLAFVPIVMVTGHTERDNIEAARDAGATEFLAKPFTAKSLHLRLATLIEQPRPFIKTQQYFGPDRRRRESGPTAAGERRSGPFIRREVHK